MRDGADGRFIPTCVGNAVFVFSVLVFYPVHPHVCGERAYQAGIPLIGHGSSPRVWGTRTEEDKRNRLMRFIPTCVGNAVADFADINIIMVHPHVCGERLFIKASLFCRRGSSPRVWGTPASSSQRFQTSRFIPTCVGNAAGEHGVRY